MVSCHSYKHETELDTYQAHGLFYTHQGRVIDSIGDNLLAEFDSVIDAVKSSVDIQNNLRSMNNKLEENRRMEYRIGVNLGDVIESDGRLYGDGVNIAARLENLAEAGGICISGTVFDQIENKLKLNIDFLGEKSVKNIPKPVRTYKIHLESNKISSSHVESSNKIRRIY